MHYVFKVQKNFSKLCNILCTPLRLGHQRVDPTNLIATASTHLHSQASFGEHKLVPTKQLKAIQTWPNFIMLTNYPEKR